MRTLSFRAQVVKVGMTCGVPKGRAASETNDRGGKPPSTADLGGQRLFQKRSLGICLWAGHGLVAWARWLEGGPPNPTMARASGTACLVCCSPRDAPSRLLSHRLQPPHSPWLEARLQGSTELRHQGLQAWRRQAAPGSGVP